MSEFAEKIQKTQSDNHSRKQVNCTGIPTQLKERVEQSTGLSLDDVRVHYNSYLPEKLDALAYTCGNQVEISPGQDNCLPHELGHVVQQKLGLVRVNAMHASGAALNTEEALEHQADEIGAGKKIDITARPTIRNIIQRKLFIRRFRNIAVKEGGEIEKKLKNDNSIFENLFEDKKQNTTEWHRKVPRCVKNDLGYLEIYKASAGILADGFIHWLHTAKQEPAVNKDVNLRNKIKEKIEDMVNKTVEKKEASYYFDSVEAFFNYLSLYRDKIAIQEDKKGMLATLTEEDCLLEQDIFWERDQLMEAGLTMPKDVNSWLKINVVNTGAGDAIVMTLPAGYLIVDLGSNLNILLNYLALRKNKHVKTESENRGIPLEGDQTCIVITHGDADHKGCSRGKLDSKVKQLLKQAIIGYSKYCKAGKVPKDKYVKLVKLLRSGMFHVCKMSEPTEGKKNSDSLVIARRLGGAEAVILCGDQEPQNLKPILDGISEGSEYKTDHMFVKIPHHGSFENNTAEIMNSFSKIGNLADFVVSAGTQYEHPTAGMFANGRRLYSQGTEVRYPANIPVSDSEPQTLGYISRSRVFYTQNLNEGQYKIIPGSVVYKSNGIEHATYSKIYTDKPNEEKDEQNKAQSPEEQNKNLSPEEEENITCIIIMVNNIGNEQYMQEEISEDICTVFCTMNEQQQISFLDSLGEADKINELLNSVNIQDLQFDQPQSWEEMLYDVWQCIDWGQNFFNIMAKTCSDQFLVDVYLEILGIENEILRDRFIKAVIIYQRNAEMFIKNVLKTNKQNGNLDSENTNNIMYEFLCHSFFPWQDESEEEDADITIGCDVLNVLDKLGSKIIMGVLKSYMKNDILSFKQVDTVLDLLASTMEEMVDSQEMDEESFQFIISILDSSFFLDLFHRYPEHYEEIFQTYERVNDYYKEINPDYEDTNTKDWYYIKNNRKGKNLEEFIKALGMDYKEYVSQLDPTTFKEDQEILFSFAYQQMKTTSEYLGDFINICYIYNELPKYLEHFQINDLPCLHRLMDEGYLKPSVMNACYDYLIKDDSVILYIAKEAPATLVYEYPAFTRAIILISPNKIPYITTLKKTLYAELKNSNGELMEELMSQHLAMHKKEAEDVLFEIILEKKIENADILLEFAYGKRNTDKQYLAALYEICLKHGNTEMLNGHLEWMLQDIEHLKCLYQLLTMNYLEPEVVNICFDLLTDKVKILHLAANEPFVLINNFPLLLMHILSKPLDIQFKILLCKFLSINSPILLLAFVEKHKDDMTEEIQLILEGISK